jgi:RNA polymerase sigma-70 factor (sigma-E family)
MERDGFERLCRDHYANVVRTAYLITDDLQEAHDIAQEAFARAFERWRTVSTLDRPEAWVHRVAANLAVSWWRRVRVRRSRPLPDAGVVEAPTMPDPALAQALRQLSPAQRTAVVLRFYADRSVEDVALALGKRPGTVRALTSQGVARLRVLLQEHDDEEVRDEDAR